MECQYLTFFCVFDNTEGYIRVNDSTKSIFSKWFHATKNAM